MAYNDYRVIISNEFLGISKEISAPSRYELYVKVENQKRIWDERVKRELAKQNKEEMKNNAERLTESDKRKIEEYQNIIHIANIQTSNNYYNSLIDNSKFKDFKTDLKKSSIEEVKEELNVPNKSWLEFFSSKKKNYRIEMEEKADKELHKREEEYDKKLKQEQLEYENKKEKFFKEQNEKNKKVEEEWNKYLQGDIKQIEGYFEYVIKNIYMPSEVVKDYEIQYLKENKTLIISYFLPNADTVPRIIQHKYVSTRNEIDEIVLTDKKFEKFYNDIVYMCCLKTINDVLNSDDNNSIDNIVYNGWIKYIDKSTGKNAQSCIITIETSKEKFLDINIENVDYKECIKGLKGIFVPSILSLTPVVPYMKINREDSRFIENKDAANIELDGFNLATMPWEDFEYFVRELFDKMFNVNGGEVKVTQASHDGGVDAIAFDEDPIRGGKFVIQAKRYNNVVPVSAVRDLYGTMIHEGATKGILVTTSSYGKEAYDFAQDKPITLIDGQALLGLLNKYGYSNLTIKINK